MKAGSSCQELSRQVARYVDGRLDEAAAATLAAHAARCARCRALIGAERRLSAALARGPAPRAPETLAESVMAAVYREALAPRGADPAPELTAKTCRRMGLSFVLSAALVAVVLLFPPGLLPPEFRTEGVAAALQGSRTSVVKDALAGADAAVRGALHSPAGAAATVQGGRSR
jgi:anti-sigma factor RsiW